MYNVYIHVCYGEECKIITISLFHKWKHKYTYSLVLETAAGNAAQSYIT